MSNIILERDGIIAKNLPFEVVALYIHNIREFIFADMNEHKEFSTLLSYISNIGNWQQQFPYITSYDIVSNTVILNIRHKEFTPNEVPKFSEWYDSVKQHIMTMI